MVGFGVVWGFMGFPMSRQNSIVIVASLPVPETETNRIHDINVHLFKVKFGKKIPILATPHLVNRGKLKFPRFSDYFFNGGKAENGGKRRWGCHPVSHYINGRHYLMEYGYCATLYG